jgi:hypothetical protein
VQLDGVNPVQHLEIFGNAAVARSYGFVQSRDGGRRVAAQLSADVSSAWGKLGPPEVEQRLRPGQDSAGSRWPCRPSRGTPERPVECKLL